MKNKWKYPVKVEQMRFTEKNQQTVLNELDTPLQRNKSRKPIRNGLTAAAIVLLLLGGALFVPSIENVVAKIPYISQFIKQEEQRMNQMDSILDEVNAVAEENGMKLRDLRMDSKEMEVHLIGLSGNNESITEQIQSKLDEAGFTGYDVKVVAYEEEEQEIETERSKEEIEQDSRDSEALKAALKERLEAQGYELMFPVSVRINNVEGIYMNVIVPESEERLEQLKEIMKEEAKVYGDDYKLDVRQVQKIAREQEIRWQKTGAISNIGRALMEADNLHVNGFSYSFHPYPLEINVKTSLELDNPEAVEIAKEIHSEIDSFIQSDEETKTIRDDQYNVKVLSKDKKEIGVE
ncbi:hypothetical protein CIL03_18225 [Virgibacillus indicus]|uniref:DUF4030 domain-containing protein n=1 Tax=Virgibacillus indicus TaxID=2024554 RepID=A0A265N513_9BACI|nr:DUF4030 domain-containing protein [Virgibacillus indicus]OZU87122.1 hypothetical protein CIL03_18225 [Virgibacillus indicus]